MNTRGNTILITGGGSGIGRALAEAFHRLDNKVIIAGRRREVLQQTAAANPGMEFVVLDTTKADSIQAAATEVLQRFPTLNTVINNAGVQRVLDFSSDPPIDQAVVAEEIDTNIVGVLKVTTAFLPHLKAQPHATVINISSGLAFLPMARYPIYCATKAFIHSFSMSLRHQLKSTSVHVVELAPPWVATDLDASHDTPTTHEGMSPMPLADFIAAAMQELSTDAEELHVAGAKFLYSSGISDKANANFELINH
ncbi:MAG TPA: SDR family NAD(P)-dependent oxidoreductase [Edaphobacter sp.]|nr:SDR family NAD(P)-dependent oxidoreductase [Edaphobacter sp.]